MFDSESEVDWPEDGVEVGRIVDAWGVKGWFKVQPYSSDPQALFSTKRWYVRIPSNDRGPPHGGANAGSTNALLKITHAKEHGDVIVASAQALTDRAASERLKGAAVFVSRASFPSSASDEFYWVDLIGLMVINRQSQVLGNVVGLLETGPHCVLRISVASGEGASPVECLVPFVSAYIDSVDIHNKVIHVDWGLDY